MRTLGKFMLGSGATFGYVLLKQYSGLAILCYAMPRNLVLMISRYDSLFMSIGSVIRTDGPHNDAWLRARGPPLMLPRQSPFRPMRQ